MGKLHKLEQETGLKFNKTYSVGDYEAEIKALLRHNGEVYVSTEECNFIHLPEYKHQDWYTVAEFKHEWGVK